MWLNGDMVGHPRRTPGPRGKELAKVLRGELAKLQLTQRSIAEKTNISTSQLSLYLKGEKSPTIDEYIDICDCLGRNPGSFFYEALANLAYDKHRKETGYIDDTRPSLREAKLIFDQAIRDIEDL